MIAEIITVADPLTTYFVENFGPVWGTFIDLGLAILSIPIVIVLSIGLAIGVFAAIIGIASLIVKCFEPRSNKDKDPDGLSEIERTIVNASTDYVKTLSEKEARKYLWKIERNEWMSTKAFYIVVKKYEDVFKTHYKSVNDIELDILSNLDEQYMTGSTDRK